MIFFSGWFLRASAQGISESVLLLHRGKINILIYSWLKDLQLSEICSGKLGLGFSLLYGNQYLG